MKLNVLTRLRTKTRRKIERHYLQLQREPLHELNHNRPTLRGRIAELEDLAAELDRIIKRVHDRYQDRRKKSA